MTTIAPNNYQSVFVDQAKAFPKGIEDGIIRLDMSESQENPNATFVQQVCPVVLSHEENTLQSEAVDEGKVAPRPDGRFACPYCHKVFNSENNFRIHLDEHQAACMKCDDSSIVRLDLTNTQDGSAAAAAFAQQMCPVVIDQEDNSIQPDPLGDIKLSARPDGRFACPYCQKLYFSENTLRTHLDVHRGLRRFQCNICGKCYAKSFLLKSHIKSVHENIRDVTCTICQKAFSKRSVMRRHMKSVHAEKKDFHCTQCHKQFTEKKNLQMHINALHKGLRPHRCGSCLKEFARKCDLLRHANSVHRECKPYTCPLCNKGFPQKWYFERHLASVHKSIFLSNDRAPEETESFNFPLAMLSSRAQQVQSQSQAVQQQQQTQQLQHMQTPQAQQQHQQQQQQLPPPPQQQQQSNHPCVVTQTHQQQQQHHFAFFQPQAQNQAMNLPMGAIIAAPGTGNAAMPSGTQVMMVAPGMNMPMPAFFFQPQPHQSPSFPNQHNAIVHPATVLPAVPTSLMQSQSMPGGGIGGAAGGAGAGGTAHFIHAPFGLATPIPVSQPNVSQAQIAASCSRPAKEYQCATCSKVYPRRQSLQAHIIQVHTDKKPYECNLCHKGFVRRWDFYRHVNSVHQDNATSAINPDKTEEYLAWMRGRRSSLDISWECMNAVRPELMRIKQEDSTSQPNPMYMQQQQQQQQQQQPQHQLDQQHQVQQTMQQQQQQQQQSHSHSSDAEHLNQFQSQPDLNSIVTSDLSGL